MFMTLVSFTHWIQFYFQIPYTKYLYSIEPGLSSSKIK